MSVRPILCGVLLAACLPATARDVRAQETAESAPCGATAAGAEAIDPAIGTQRRAPAPSGAKARTSAGGIDTETPSRGPRWHSFLPGMFR
ncbi:hypothetical protein PQS31_13750 [Luteimonas sp BLCC-B24]|uniref:hypothetical protein n=1 Tax=Luteimonas sp. BLCC-B24 TaxID=3025317 RepID=UPI00234CF2F0|nr:hypothetical protein [Luteimonas sp. BLCC-B24]MDC7807875.1 hypothetical protein [Luteimonas sp. BLCC-B24]